jgi:hypothetical protein
MLTAGAARTVLQSNQNLTPRALATAIQSLGISTDVSGRAAELYALNGNKIPDGFNSYYSFAMSLYGEPLPAMQTPAPLKTTANLIPASVLTGAHWATDTVVNAAFDTPTGQAKAVAAAAAVPAATTQDVSPVSVPGTVPATTAAPGMTSHMPGDVASPAVYYGGGGSAAPISVTVPSSSMTPVLLVAGLGALLLFSKKGRA